MIYKDLLKLKVIYINACKANIGVSYHTVLKRCGHIDIFATTVFKGEGQGEIAKSSPKE